MKFLAGEIFEELNTNETKRNSYKTLYNMLNSCDISSIILDSNIFYIETIQPYNEKKMEIAKKQLKNYMLKYYKSYYLYDIIGG